MNELREKKPGRFQFDGKKDDTLFVETDEQGKKKTVIVKLEHVSVISEPGGEYITHLTPGGKGVEIGKELTGFLREYGLIETLHLIGADSIFVNTK